METPSKAREFPPYLLWCAFLAAIAAASWLLDAYQHLLIGQLGLWIARLGYLVFAVVVTTRFLSLRSDGFMEKMLRSYQGLTGEDLSGTPLFRVQPLQLWFYFLLLALAMAATVAQMIPFTKAYSWGAFFDLGIWLLLLVWISWTHLLKSTRRREILKELLDDARSRGKTKDESFSPPPLKWHGFGTLGIVFLLLLSAFGSQRVSSSSIQYEIAQLKRCLKSIRELEQAVFLATGMHGQFVDRVDCLDPYRAHLKPEIRFASGEIEVVATETGVEGDYFRDQEQGNQSLVLRADGRFTMEP